VNNRSATRVDTIARIDHDEAMVLAAHEFDRTVDVLRALDADDWSRPTDCSAWDVRALALHLLGAAAANASLRENVHQMRLGRKLYARVGAEKHWEHWIDGVNEIQIADRAPLPNERIASEYAAVAPKAVRARTRLPRPVRALPVVDLPAPWTKRMSLGYLMDIVYTRDVWMHRVDIARAAGQELVLTPEHDGRLVEDLVGEWATLYADPFELVLTGPAGGHYRTTADGERVEIDAVEFVRVLSGRAPGTGVLANVMPL
jgi:uncharacterized protein (TIGR03083 family)